MKYLIFDETSLNCCRSYFHATCTCIEVYHSSKCLPVVTPSRQRSPYHRTLTSAEYGLRQKSVVRRFVCTITGYKSVPIGVSLREVRRPFSVHSLGDYIGSSVTSRDTQAAKHSSSRGTEINLTTRLVESHMGLRPYNRWHWIRIQRPAWSSGRRLTGTYSVYSVACFLQEKHAGLRVMILSSFRPASN